MPRSTEVSAALAKRLRGRGAGTRRTNNSRDQASRDNPIALPRSPVATGVPLLDPPLRCSKLVDILGPHGGGKTVLLHHVAAHALGHLSGDSPVEVVWIDMNGAFDAFLLRRVAGALRPEGLAEEEFLSDSLSRIHVYSPHCTTSLLCTLHSLFEFFRSPVGNRVRVLIVDALGTHHYLDAARSDSARRNCGDINDLEQAVTAVLRRLLSTFDIECYVSKCALFEPHATPACHWPFHPDQRPPLFQDFMPHTWSSLAQTILVLYRVGETRLAVVLVRQEGRNSGLSSSSSANVPLALSSFKISDVGISFGEVQFAPDAIHHEV